jgi:hypothetical protein
MAGVTRPDTPKVILVFAAGGIASGLLGGILDQLPIPGVLGFSFFFGPGFYFFLALSGSLWIARRVGWLALTFGWKRCVASAAIVAISYPLGLYVMADNPFFSDTLDMLSSALVVSLLVWTALSILTRAWKWKSLLAFVAAGFLWSAIFTWVGNRFDSQLRAFAPSGAKFEWAMVTALLTVGECLFGGIVGYFLSRIDARRLV